MSPQLLHGASAVHALQQLCSSAKLVGLAAFPQATASSTVSVLAASDGHTQILLDAGRTPQLAAAWPRNRPIAAQQAQLLQHSLWRSALGGPDRWACLHINEQLLQGVHTAVADSEALSKRYALAQPAGDSLAALAQQAAFVAQVGVKQGAALQAAKMAQVSRIEAAAIRPLAAIERAGMPFDTAAWRQCLAADQAELAALAADPQQKEAHLALQRLQLSHGEAFLRNVASDNRVHAAFAQIGATTGRMACSRPNLQGIPKARGRRASFACRAGRVLVAGDYAACELRILAELSGDPDYRQAFAAGQDVHAHIAQRLFGAAGSTAQLAERRQAAKTLSFGLIYGMQAAGLAKQLGVDGAAAQQMQKQFFATYPGLRAYLEDSSAAHMRRGFVTTLAGRRLPLQEPDSEAVPQHRLNRLARNMPIQGSGADLIKAALAHLAAALAPLDDAQIVHCVHDSLIVECPEQAAPAVAACLQQSMQAAGETLVKRVVCSVDVHTGRHWD